jgi:hypothetical protein
LLPARGESPGTWLQSVGLVGLCFFAAKGFVWLAFMFFFAKRCGH